MGLPDVLHALDLHDSSLVSIVYDAEPRNLRIHVDLCNWRQDSYTDDQPQIIRCVITFSGVSSFKMVGSGHDELNHNEIVAAKISAATGLPGLHRVDITMRGQFGQGTATLEVVATTAYVTSG